MVREFDRQEIAKAKAFIHNKRIGQTLELKALHKKAASDAALIIDMIIRDYNPIRVYQWGSLIYPENFRTYSDIDIGVEGINNPEVYFGLLGVAQSMTEFPVDIVQMEKIESEYAKDIRTTGRLVYEHK